VLFLLDKSAHEARRDADARRTFETMAVTGVLATCAIVELEILYSARNQERLRYFLASVSPSRAQVVAEAGGWSVFIPGLPIAADGATLDEALDEMVAALREYAEDWQDRLLDAPNHAGNWGLVQLVTLSSDGQLRDWLVGSTP
jgi:predicted RNase H-like HicB family nuclease